MTENTERFNDHIILSCLEFIKISPEYIISDANLKADLRLIYPGVNIDNDIDMTKKIKPDLIINNNLVFSEDIFKFYKKNLKSGGLLLFRLNLNVSELNVSGLADFLTGIGFEKVVLDRESGYLYGHACQATQIGVSISQIRRMT